MNDTLTGVDAAQTAELQADLQSDLQAERQPDRRVELPWRSSSAVLIGRDHVLLGRNGQDHAVARAGDGLAVAAVADGCGEARGSELGARVSAIVAVRVATSGLGAGTPMESIPARVGQEVIRALRAVAVEVAAEEAAAFASSHLLATLLVAVARGDEAMVFGWGDGLFRIDERVLAIDEGGRPRYLAADLWGEAVPACSFTERVDCARYVAVASDGFDDRLLAELPAASSSALLRWMRVRGRDGAFVDDGAIGLVAREARGRAA